MLSLWRDISSGCPVQQKKQPWRERQSRFRSEAVTTLFFSLSPNNRPAHVLMTHRARDHEVLSLPIAESVGGDPHFLLFRGLSCLPRAGSVAERKPPTSRVPRSLSSLSDYPSSRATFRSSVVSGDRAFRRGRRAPCLQARLRKEPSMLVRSLQCCQTIMVGDDIEITVVHIGGDSVQLGITAPSEVSVHREEPGEANPRETTGETETIWLCMN